MKMKTSELEGTALDWAVAQCKGIEHNNWEVQYVPDGEVEVLTFYCTADNSIHAIEQCERYSPDCTIYDYAEINPFCPSTNWAQGGPIIEQEKIIVDLYQDNGWCCLMFEDENAIAEEHGPTPLAAAMRCYVASKLGNEVEIPDLYV